MRTSIAVFLVGMFMLVNSPPAAGADPLATQPEAPIGGLFEIDEQGQPVGMPPIDYGTLLVEMVNRRIALRCLPASAMLYMSEMPFAYHGEAEQPSHEIAKQDWGYQQ